MGLDNIPYVYPCIDEGLQDPDEEIDCQRNIEEGMCPWDREMGHKQGGILGMFGTHCWYRGKSGNHMLQELESKGYTAPISFYGSGADGEEILSSKECLELSRWMAEHAEVYASICNTEYSSLEEVMDSYKYAIDWLEFVSEYNGSNVWY